MIIKLVQWRRNCSGFGYYTLYTLTSFSGNKAKLKRPLHCIISVSYEVTAYIKYTIKLGSKVVLVN